MTVEKLKQMRYFYLQAEKDAKRLDRVPYDKREEFKDHISENMMKSSEMFKFIDTIPDMRVREIAALRLICGYSWRKIADTVGGCASDDCARKAFVRYVKSTEENDEKQ